MLLIDCPWCGPRDEIEFSYGGESHLRRPDNDAEWTEYLFFRKNPKGLAFERWVHAQGCRQWFNLARDTVSHRVLAIYAMGEAPPRDTAS